ncbi:MAG: SulP family inorganic anion transporter [Planctomycetota bacterium]|nr:MAG: SulP family inorganic anion transporter [Planctomycetota bacterium]
MPKPIASIRHDLPASVVVFFVALPLCLGIALASGAPLLSGLIAGVIGGVVVGLVSGSPLGVSGPAAGLAVIVLGAISTLGFEAFLVSVVLAGLMQVGLGIARAGPIGYFFPSAVIKGMLAGIGVIIVLKQIPHALGYDKDPEGELAFVQPDGDTTLGALTHMLSDVQPGAVVITVVSLAILLLWERVLAKRARVFKLLPGPLVAVLFGVGFEVITSRVAPSLSLSESHLVSVPVVASLSEFGGLLVSPDWSRIGDSAVWITAFTIAIVASLETLLCVAATDKLDAQRRVTPTSRELVAQGAGNLLSGLAGGLPITQVIVRSSANIQSGGRTKLSAVLHGLWLALFVLALPGFLNLIPLAVLAAILLVVGCKLARPALVRQMWALGPGQFLPFVATILGIVFTDLLTGIGVGLGVAVLVILRRNYQNAHVLHLEESDEPGRRHRVVMRLSEEVSFLNKGAIRHTLNQVTDGSRVSIDMSACVVRDHDVLEVIDDFCASAEERDILVAVTDVPDDAIQRRRTSGSSTSPSTARSLAAAILPTSPDSPRTVAS